MAERSGRRRALVAAAGVLGAGFALSASAVGARPSVASSISVASGASRQPRRRARRRAQPRGSPATAASSRSRAAGRSDPAVAEPIRTSTVYLTDREGGDHRDHGGSRRAATGQLDQPRAVRRRMQRRGRHRTRARRVPRRRHRAALGRLSAATTHCGGTPGDWELVSTGPGGALARDDVTRRCTRGLARRHADRLHPSRHRPLRRRITSVTVVDLATGRKPLSSRAVAGMPISRPTPSTSMPGSTSRHSPAMAASLPSAPTRLDRRRSRLGRRARGGRAGDATGLRVGPRGSRPVPGGPAGLAPRRRAARRSPVPPSRRCRATAGGCVHERRRRAGAGSLPAVRRRMPDPGVPPRS